MTPSEEAKAYAAKHGFVLCTMKGSKHIMVECSDAPVHEASSYTTAMRWMCLVVNTRTPANPLLKTRDQSNAELSADIRQFMDAIKPAECPPIEVDTPAPFGPYVDVDAKPVLIDSMIDKVLTETARSYQIPEAMLRGVPRTGFDLSSDADITAWSGTMTVNLDKAASIVFGKWADKFESIQHQTYTYFDAPREPRWVALYRVRGRYPLYNVTGHNRSDALKKLRRVMNSADRKLIKPVSIFLERN